MHRFFLPGIMLNAGKNVTLDDPELFHQVKNVLRMKDGERIIVLDNDGFEYELEIQEFLKEKIVGSVLARRKNTAEPALRITLYQAIPKKMELFELVLQKGTEIGVKKFVPLITARTERKSLSKQGRLFRIIKEAAEQSGRGVLPELAEPETFKNSIERWKKELAPLALLFDQRGGKFSLKNDKETAIAVFIGPEGGFTHEELDLAKNNGVKIVSLGSRILRTETAGIVIPALLLIC